MGSAGAGGDTASSWSASVAPVPRRLETPWESRCGGRAGVRAGAGTGELPAPSVPPPLEVPQRPGAAAPLCGCPALPARLRARRDPHGGGSEAATAPRAPRWRQRDPAGRDGTGRATGDPAAGPAGLGGLGRPLPLQSSEMAEHVAIMPRHSGCPARLALISGPRTPLLFPCAPRMGNKTQHVSAAPAHKAPGLGLSGGQSGPSISAPGPLCPSPPCHTFCSRIQ